MKTTAVEWLTKKLRVEFGFAFSDNILEQAKEIEKQHVIDAYLKDRPKATINKALVTWDKAEQYYKEKFKK